MTRGHAPGNEGDGVDLRELANWLLPPAGPLLLALLGLLLLRLRLGLVALIAGLGLLYALSLPATSHALMAPLQRDFAVPDPAALEPLDAIVVLGAGYRSGAREYAGETVNELALVRLRYAARLHRQTGLPVLASGGAAEGREPEARWMAEVLEEFGVDPVLREEQSRDTLGNARYSAELLGGQGMTRVALVTHAHHMPRALGAFERTALEVMPAPTAAFVPHDRGFSVASLRPQARALHTSWLALHEYLGLAWYRWRDVDD